jgi:hypothetical protein
LQILGVEVGFKSGQDPCVVADRLSVKERLNPEEEKLRFPR